MTPGTLAIWLAAALGVTAFVAALRWARGREASAATFRLAYNGMTVVLAVATVFLMVAILAHDFRYDYVARYSSRDLPFLYLFSAFWGGQEGTFLLWALFSALMGYALFRKRSWEPAAVMACYVPTILFLIGLMVDVPGLYKSGGNPFRLALPVPPDGSGLNDLLQDPWMASHPPAVFVGYAALTIPGVLAFVALLKKQEERWLGAALRWSLFGFLSLGVGVVLGAFWAYKTLGWGGYWGWDPVENASLIPWIVSATLIHGLLVQRATGALRRTNLVLSLAAYWLVVYSTFLTRTGVLAKFSVHSFEAGTSFWAVPVNVEMLAALALVLAAGAWALVRRGRMAASPVDTKLAWPLVLLIVIAVMSGSALLVFWGTTFPLPSSLVGRPGTYDASWYNRWNLPLYVLLLGLLSVGPFLSWAGRPAKEWSKHLILPLIAGAVGCATALALGFGGAGELALFFVAVAAMTANVVRLVLVAREKPLHTGAAIAHVGFALMFVGMVASGAWGRKHEVRLPLGQPVEAAGLTLTFRGHVDGSEPKDHWRVALMAPGKAEDVLEVRMYSKGRGEDGRDQIMRFPAIHREIARDVYVAPLSLDAAGGAGTLELTRGRSVPYRDATFTFVKFETPASGEEHVMTVRALVRIARGSQQETVSLPMRIAEGRLVGEAVSPKSLPGVSLTLDRMSVEDGLVLVRTDDGSGEASAALVVEASVKPLIGLLWAGTLLLGVGCTIAAVRRWSELRAMPAGPVPLPVPAVASAGLGTVAGTSGALPRSTAKRAGNRPG
jgi:cytochrome c-type biogenesis protein CcmF